MIVLFDPPKNVTEAVELYNDDLITVTEMWEWIEKLEPQQRYRGSHLKKNPEITGETVG